MLMAIDAASRIVAPFTAASFAVPDILAMLPGDIRCLRMATARPGMTIDVVATCTVGPTYRRRKFAVNCKKVDTAETALSGLIVGSNPPSPP